MIIKVWFLLVCSLILGFAAMKNRRIAPLCYIIDVVLGVAVALI